MIGLDTNVLVRYVMGDDEKQAARAASFIDAVVGRGERLFVGQIVLCELVWVLGAAYGRSRQDIVGVLKAVVRTAQFVIEDVELARRALSRFESGTADFADYVIAESALQAGSEQVVTFDKKLLQESGFVSP